MWHRVLCINQSSQEKETNRIYERQFIIKIGSKSYEGWEVPWSAVHRLGRPRAAGVLVHVQGPENQDLQCLAAEDRGPSSSKKSKFVLPLLRALFRPSRDWMMPPAWIRTLFTDTNASLFWKQPQKEYLALAQIYCLTWAWAMKVPSQLWIWYLISPL